MGLLSPLLKNWRIKKVSKWISGKRILDCGCGDGVLLDVIGEDTDYTGIDINREHIDNAKSRRLNAKFLMLDVEGDLKVHGKFDVIVMCALIEHLKNPERFLSIISRLLAKNGRIVITTPTPKANKILNLGSAVGIFDMEAFKEHKSYFTYDDFGRIAKNLGLKIEHYEKFQLGLNQLVVLCKAKQ